MTLVPRVWVNIRDSVSLAPAGAVGSASRSGNRPGLEIRC